MRWTLSHTAQRDLNSKRLVSSCLSFCAMYFYSIVYTAYHITYTSIHTHLHSQILSLFLQDKFSGFFFIPLEGWKRHPKMLRCIAETTVMEAPPLVPRLGGVVAKEGNSPWISWAMFGGMQVRLKCWYYVPSMKSNEAKLVCFGGLGSWDWVKDVKGLSLRVQTKSMLWDWTLPCQGPPQTKHALTLLGLRVAWLLIGLFHQFSPRM